VRQEPGNPALLRGCRRAVLLTPAGDLGRSGRSSKAFPDVRMRPQRN
jgi:hypothetical protein